MAQTTDAVLAQIDNAIDDRRVGPDAMRCNAPAGAGLASLPSPPRFDSEQIARVNLRVKAAFEDFSRGMAQLAASINKMVDNNPALRRLLGLPVYDRHHPRPLCIDGAAYARKRKARKARR